MCVEAKITHRYHFTYVIFLFLDDLPKDIKMQMEKGMKVFKNTTIH